MAIVEQFLEGNRRRYTATFKVPDENGAVTDPSPVNFYRRKLGTDPATLETYLYGVDDDVVRVSAGVYQIDLDYPTDGRYVIGAEGGGPCTAYAELDVVVGNAKARP